MAEEEIVYVVITHSFKDSSEIYPQVFKNEKDAVRYAYYDLLNVSGFDIQTFKKNEEDCDEDDDDEDDQDEEDGVEYENEYDLSKFDEKDRNLPRKEIVAKYEPSTVHEFNASVYMLRKLGFKYIHEFVSDMSSDSDYACEIFKQKIR